jgi:acyl-coenzyme A synthetase/AMP-(fatty) acid ligase
MLRNQDICRKYDLSSVRLLYSGAAPLGPETIQEVNSLYPTWSIGQAYGTHPILLLTLDCFPKTEQEPQA